MQSTEPPVIIENSSFTCRAGLESEKGPSVCIPTIVGEKRVGNQQSILIGNQINDEMVDYELFYPIEFGMIKDWNRMELIWQHIFEKELKVKSENHATLITQAPRTPKHIKEQMAETMFEKFKVPSFHVSNQSVLTLYSSGRTTGTVLESGDGVTYSLPIYEGYILKHALQRINIGGRNCSSQLLRLINDSKISDLEQSKRMKIINEIKELYCYVALDPEKEEQKFKNNPSQKFFYYLPDGNEIVLKNQAYLCTEILFQPHKAQFEFDGLHEIVNRSIQNSDFDLWSKLYENILLSGGNCLFSGLQERLQSEISNLSPKSLKVRVISHPNKLNSTWLGGSILSTLSTFQSFWVSKSEYEEMGSRALFIKCF